MVFARSTKSDLQDMTRSYKMKFWQDLARQSYKYLQDRQFARSSKIKQDYFSHSLNIKILRRQNFNVGLYSKKLWALKFKVPKISFWTFLLIWPNQGPKLRSLTMNLGFFKPKITPCETSQYLSIWQGLSIGVRIFHI